MSAVDNEKTLPTAPAVVREQPGGDSMRAIIRWGSAASTACSTPSYRNRCRNSVRSSSFRAFDLNHAKTHMRPGE